MWISNFDFGEPVADANELRDEGGAYVVMADNGSRLRMVDCGESLSVKETVLASDRWQRWLAIAGKEQLIFLALYTDGNTPGSTRRQEIVRLIRSDNPLLPPL